jgi:cation transport ATPase
MFHFEDKLRSNAAETIRTLKDMGLNVSLLSGGEQQ